MPEIDYMDEDYVYESAGSTFRCEDCGYKWQGGGLSDDPFEENEPEEDSKEKKSTVEDDEDTHYYDSDDTEPAMCPICGSADNIEL